MEKIKTILLVEDEVIIALATAQMLKKHGYNVLTANNSQKAISTAIENLNIELILMDIDLGKGPDGTEAAKVILNTRHIPILFLSSHTEPEVVERTEKITSYGYVVKNSIETVLLASIKMAFKLFDAHNNISEKNKELDRTNEELHRTISQLEIANELLAKSKHELVKSEEKHRILLDKSSDPIFSFSSEGVYLYVNKAFADGVEKKIEEIVNHSIWDVFPKDEADRRFSALQYAFQTGNEKVIDVKVPFSTGDRYFITTITPIKDSEGIVSTVICSSKEITERRRSDIALRESESKFKAFMDFSPDFMIVKDHEFRVIYHNDSISKFFPTGTWIGKKPHELFPPEIADPMVKVDAEALEKKSIVYEEVWKDIYGIEHIFETTKFRIDIPEKNPLIGAIISDITFKKKLEQTLTQSETNYRTIFDASSEAIFIGDTSLTKIIDVNEAAVKMYGYKSKEELINVELSTLSANGNNFTNGKVEMFVKNKLENGTQTFEYLAKRKNGSFFPIETSLKIANIGGSSRILAVARDISERKKAEEELTTTKLILEQAFNQSSVGMLLITLPDYIIRFSNDAYQEQLGVKDELAYVGTSLLDFKPSYRLYNSSGIEHCIDDGDLAKAIKGERISNIVGSVKRKDGTIRWNLASSTPIYNKENKIIAVYQVLTDITDRILTEEKVKRLLEENEMILRDVHHRIKNNMNTIISLLSLQANTLENEDARVALDDASNRIRSMMLLYDKLYRANDFSEMEVKSFLSPLIKEIVDVFPNSKSVKIQTDIEDFSLKIKTLSHLGIMINEIITNSMKHAFANGTKGNIFLFANKRDGLITVVAGNDGTPIPNSIDFEESLGFGLKIIRLVTTQFNGTIKIDRKGGTKFILEFRE